MSHWYTIQNASLIDTPALVIYPDRVQENIAQALAMTGTAKRLRPHVKTNKSPDAVKLMLQAGITKFKCATIAEAEMLAMSGAVNILLAYQPVGPKADRYFNLISTYPQTVFSCLTDNKLVAEQLACAAVENNVRLQVYIDVDAGMHRTGIAIDEVLPLYEFCSTIAGLELMGLHVYDGHIRDSNLEERALHCNTVFKTIEGLSDAIVMKGLPAPIIVAGGSPTFAIHAKRQSVECSPGTFIYWDKGYATLCPDQPFQTAALVLARIISMPDAYTLCIDLGHKSIASENVLQQRVTFLNAPELEFIGQSEEHLVAKTALPNAYQIGDLLYGLPHHICPTVALYERAITIRNGSADGEWMNTARDRRITI